MSKTEKGATKGKSAGATKDLAKKGGKADIELKEDELKRVSGGAGLKYSAEWVE